MHKDSFFENRNVGSDKAIFQKTLFCCVYDLDKRCSFFANLPWTLHDKDIDESVFDLVHTLALVYFAAKSEPQPYFHYQRQSKGVPVLITATESPPPLLVSDDRVKSYTFRDC